MNILVAPNSMKGSLSAFDFADTVEKALLKSLPESNVRKIPVADGGDYTAEVLSKALKANPVGVDVHGPLGDKIKSKYFVIGKTAIIEMAEASGMKLVKPDELNPLKATSYGTGELIANAIDNGCEKILLAIGGSASVDGGMGMLGALGFCFYDKSGTELTGNGKNLTVVNKIVSPEIKHKLSIKIICDVENPLLGDAGAVKVFGPQKGATPEMVEQLEQGLKNWSLIIKKNTGRQVENVKGSGAAGGIAVPLIAFFNAEIVRGADFILSELDFEEHVKWADLVITGEGKLDKQTLYNKAPFAVAQCAKKLNKPVIALAGSAEFSNQSIFDGVFAIMDDAVSLKFAMKNAKELLFDLTCRIAGNIESFRLNEK